MWLTRFSIQRPIVVAMFFIALAIFGAISFCEAWPKPQSECDISRSSWSMRDIPVRRLRRWSV